jgi:hypothetical protein
MCRVKSSISWPSICFLKIHHNPRESSVKGHYFLGDDQQRLAWSGPVIQWPDNNSRSGCLRFLVLVSKA